MKRRFLAMLLSVAMVLTMLPVTAFAADPANSNGTVALAELTQLTVRAIKATGADGKITLKVTVKDNNTAVTNFYYKTAASGNITEPTASTEITTSGNDAWTEYTGPFVVTTEPAEVGVVAVTTTDDKLMPTSYGSTSNILTALGELTVTIGTTGNDADPNAIVVKNGDTTVDDATFYVLDDAAAKKAFDEARVDWASDTETDNLKELGTAITPPVTKITEAQNGKYLVAVKKENNAFSAVGVTSVPVKFTRPFKLYAGEVASGSETTATDLIADATYDSENTKYVVTVPAGTEKVTVGTGASVEVKQGSGGSVPANSNVVTLSTDGTTTITVSIGQGQSETYDVDITPVKPVVKNGNNELPLTRNGSTYTHTPELDHDVEFVTVSGPEGGCKVTSVKNDTATTTNGTVYLNDGANNLEVSFDDGGKCTVVITRKAAAPAVALYEGEKATGTDLLADLTADQNNVYEVSVPSTVEKVTVGAKAGTIASVKYTPPAGGNATDAANNTVPLNEGLTTITVKFADDATTTFTIKVTKAKAFVPLKVTKADDGKVVVARAEGTGEVPTGLDVVVLAKEPTWTAATTQTQVTTDTTNALVASVAYDADTATVPAAGESDKYVVVYKVEDSLVVAFGVMTVPKEERSITVNATDTDTGLLNFDSSIHEYTISIPADVANATVVCGPGAARIGCDTPITDNVVAKKTGAVSTVTVTFTGVENGEYKIKLVWAKDVGDITPNNQKVTTTPTDGNVNLVGGEAEVSILQAISSTSAVNENKGSDNPVQITATTVAGDTATTTVNLPASAAELLKDTETDAKVVTDAGEVTIPSEAIKQTQLDPDGDPAAPVAIAVVVAKKTANDDAEAGIVEAAKFEVTVKKATEDGMVDAGIKDLAKPITLVFKVRKDAIGEMKNPRLAYVKPAATVGGKPTYEKLPEAPEPTFDEATQIYTFTGKTSHLSEFAVVAEEATTASTPTITKITVSGAEEFTFKADESSFDVTALPESKTVSVVITTDTGKYDGITVNGSPYGTEGVKVDLESDGTATIEIKVNDTLKYTLNVTKKADPTVKEITNIKLTAKDGTTAVAGFTFAKTTYEYPNVVTDITPVLVTVEGDTTNVTVDEKPYTDAVEVVPTADGTKVTIAYNGDTKASYEITLKTKSTTPVDPTAPVSNTVLVGSTEYTVEFDDANAKGERISKETLTMESTDETVTLTIADGAIVKLDGVETTGVLVDNTYTVTVEEPGDHTITVTDSEGKNPYIINLTKKPAVVDETKVPTISNGDKEESIEFVDKGDNTFESKNPITVASSASSYKLNVAAGATVTVNGEPVKGVPAGGGEVTVSLDGNGPFEIVIENKDGTKYIVNVEKQKDPGRLDITKKGSVNIFTEVEISNIKAGKYYLVRIDAPASVVRPKSDFCLILNGDSYASSGIATIAPIPGSEIVVEEYTTMKDLSEFDSSLSTDSATLLVR